MTFHWLWIAWLALFLPIELPAALRHNYAGTLTAHTRWAFCWGPTTWCCPGGPISFVCQRRLFWRTRRAVFLTFWTALTLHFVAGLTAWPWLTVSSVPFAATFVVATLFERGEN